MGRPPADNRDKALLSVQAWAWRGATVAFAVLLHLKSGLPLGWSFLLLMVGLPLAGLLITIDDDLPGGWANPNGDIPPPWAYPEFWGEFILRASVAGAGFAIDAGWNTREGLQAWGGALACVCIGGALSLRAWRWLFPGRREHPNQ